MRHDSTFDAKKLPCGGAEARFQSGDFGVKLLAPLFQPNAFGVQRHNLFAGLFGCGQAAEAFRLFDFETPRLINMSVLARERLATCNAEV